MSHRPIGITISALVLGWLAIAGAGNAVLRISSDISLGVLATIYAIAAGTACVGLWRMRPFGVLAFRAWCIVVALGVAELLLSRGFPWFRAVIFSLLAGVVLFFWHRYLARSLPAG